MSDHLDALREDLAAAQAILGEVPMPMNSTAVVAAMPLLDLETLFDTRGLFMPFEFTDLAKTKFEYSDGENIVFADPTAIERAIKERLPNRAQLVSAWAAGEALNDTRTFARLQYEEQRKNDPALPEKDFSFTPEEEKIIQHGQRSHREHSDTVRQIFALKDFDPRTGTGCTEMMVVQVWNAFWGFWNKIKYPQDMPVA